MTITLDTIYKEILALKDRIERLELLVALPEEEISEEELDELREIREEMRRGEKIPWRPK